jgi:hypothetical protein
MSKEDQDSLYDKLPKLQNAKYDFGAFAYLGLVGLRKFLFGTPLPAKNALARNGQFLCTELGGLFRKYLTDPEVDLGMTTPDALFKLFKQRADRG